MLNIADADALARALGTSLDPALARLLRLRRDQLLDGTAILFSEAAHFIVVEPPDTVKQLEEAAGYPVVTDPAFEWVADHGGWLEAVTILSDDGFALVLFVPDDDAVDATLLQLLRGEAELAPTADTDALDEEQPTARRAG